MDILYELFKDMPRQGPGTDESTKRAYSLVQNLPSQPRILDIGCGSGTQTLALANAGDGQITAVDIYPAYLDILNSSASSAGVEAQISTLEASMFELPFDESAYDLIWSEGAIYVMGFEDGIRNWDRFLAPGGSIVVSELSWLKKNPPKELAEFWGQAYPGIGSIEENIGRAKDCGYRLRGFFTLPEEGWWEEFYTHLQKRIGEFREQYADNREALELISNEEKEIALYAKYSQWYGYVFYILEKPR